MTLQPQVRSSEPPGPRGRFPLDLLLRVRLNPLEFFTETARTYGGMAYFRIGPQRIYLLSEPRLIGELLATRADSFRKGHTLEGARRLLGDGLLTSEGEWHRRQRRLAQPAFAARRMDGYARTTVDVARRHAGAWPVGPVVDVYERMLHLTLVIAGHTFFGCDLERDKTALGRAILDILKMADILSLPQPVVRLIERLPLPFVRRYHRGRRRLDELIHELIRSRRRRPAENQADDLFTRILREADAAGGVSERQLRDEAVTLLLAGHETTALALTWALHALAQNPDAEARFHGELDRVLGESPPAPADLPRLEFTRRVLAETMRLFPPSWAMERRAVRECTVGDYVIPAGSLAIASQWVTHRSPRWWDRPEMFDPDRWLPEAAANRPKYAYFPFGAGRRQCIGEGFAWMQGTLVLATVGQRLRLRSAAGHRVVCNPGLLLRPKYGLQMVAERRRKP